MTTTAACLVESFGMKLSYCALSVVDSSLGRCPPTLLRCAASRSCSPHASEEQQLHQTTKNLHERTVVLNKLPSLAVAATRVPSFHFTPNRCLSHTKLLPSTIQVQVSKTMSETICSIVHDIHSEIHIEIHGDFFQTKCGTLAAAFRH